MIPRLFVRFFDDFALKIAQRAFAFVSESHRICRKFGFGLYFKNQSDIISFRI